jgi:hypothetical protein
MGSATYVMLGACVMLKHHSRSYGKYTAWALGKSAELAHSAAAHSDEIRNAMRYETRTASTAAERALSKLYMLAIGADARGF